VSPLHLLTLVVVVAAAAAVAGGGGDNGSGPYFTRNSNRTLQNVSKAGHCTYKKCARHKL
jgi:hypothetical protein